MNDSVSTRTFPTFITVMDVRTIFVRFHKLVQQAGSIFLIFGRLLADSQRVCGGVEQQTNLRTFETTILSRSMTTSLIKLHLLRCPAGESLPNHPSTKRGLVRGPEFTGRRNSIRRERVFVSGVKMRSRRCFPNADACLLVQIHGSHCKQNCEIMPEFKIQRSSILSGICEAGVKVPRIIPTMDIRTHRSISLLT